MQTIKVEAPAKINLTLEILNKRPDGYHNIKSIMQAINLCDYLTVTITDNTDTEILLSGNSKDIPYNEKNLVYKATTKFLEKANIKNKKIEIYLEKNIPIEAGLAGGSTDAAATFIALNSLCHNPLTDNDIEELCAMLGSDLNFCLYGGTAICTGRGENIKQIETVKSPLTLIKPKNLGISTKEAYAKFSQMQDKSVPNNTEKLAENFDESLFFNSFEKAYGNEYPELTRIKNSINGATMSGSGPTFFVLKNEITTDLKNDEFLIIENLEFVDHGVRIVN